MPRVLVLYDRDTVDDEILTSISAYIGNIVSSQLSCKEYKLNPNNISLHFESYSPFDIHERQIEIYIEAFDMPSRSEVIDIRNNNMLYFLGKIIPADITFFIWTSLSHGAFSAR